MDKTLLKVKEYALKQFNNPYCECCENDDMSNLIIHHLSYDRDSIIYDSFEDNVTGQIQYYAMLCDEIKYNRTNLRIMCFDCHSTLEGYIKEVKAGELNTRSDVEEKIQWHLYDMFLLTLRRQGISYEVY